MQREREGKGRRQDKKGKYCRTKVGEGDSSRERKGGVEKQGMERGDAKLACPPLSVFSSLLRLN